MSGLSTQADYYRPAHQVASARIRRQKTAAVAGKQAFCFTTVIDISGALEALADHAYLQQTLENVAAARDEIARIADVNDLSVVPSATNFVALDCGQDGDFAKRVLDGLIRRGIFVRMPFVAPQNRCIRLSAGRPDDMELVAQALPEALAEARAESD